MLVLQNGQFLEIIFLPEKIDKYQTRYFGASPHPVPNMGQILDRYFPAAGKEVLAGPLIRTLVRDDDRRGMNEPLFRPCFWPSGRHGMTL